MAGGLNLTLMACMIMPRPAPLALQHSSPKVALIMVMRSPFFTLPD